MYDGDLGRCVLAIRSDGFVTKKKIGCFFPDQVWKFPGRGCDGPYWAACPPVDQGFGPTWVQGQWIRLLPAGWWGLWGSTGKTPRRNHLWNQCVVWVYFNGWFWQSYFHCTVFLAIPIPLWNKVGHPYIYKKKKIDDLVIAEKSVKWKTNKPNKELPVTRKWQINQVCLIVLDYF